jgi:O2-independent ubiquinone biosynthesis accessory factor UbiT
MFRRLGDHGQARFVLDPTDLPVSMLLEPRGGQPRIHLSRRKLQGDARIAGPLAGLLGLVHGAYDGDALFFSRDLGIEGDTAAVLALRNAIDDAELDLSVEAQTMSGRFAAPVRWLIEMAEAQTGVALSRHEEDPGW